MVSFILPGNSATGGYEVANSVRFNDDDSAHLKKTFSSSGNQRTFTISFWFKRSNLANGNIYTYQDASNEIRSEFILYDNYLKIVFNPTGSSWSSDMIVRDSSGNNILFRDSSAWYHVVMAFDTTQSTEANRLKVYVNGNQQTMSAYPSQNFDTGYNTDIEHGIGNYIHATNTYFDGYFAEFCVVDGSQLNATSFGEFDEDSPTIWKPIDVSGLTFGTNGFYLDFEDSSSLGNDAAGSNNFTATNLAATDQSTDTCTNNFATLNPNQSNNAKDSVNSLAEGNLRFNDTNNADWRTVIGTLGVNSGKWYWEAEVVGMNGSILVGVGRQNYLPTTLNKTSSAYPGADSGDFSASYRENGIFYTNGSSSSGKSTFTSAGDIVMVALDMDNGAVYFGVNGTWNDSGDPTSGASKTGASYTGIQTGEFYSPSVSGSATNSTIDFNFGNPPFTISSGNSDANGYGNFEYAVPSGYYALNSKNLAEFG